MKKTILMFAAAGLMLATPSCKKGENDPFMSLSSRKARVSGEWMLSGYEYSDRTDDSGDNSYWTNASTYSDGTITNTFTYVDDNGTSTASTSTITVDKFSYIFEKDGTWNSEINTTEVDVSSTTIFGTTYTTTTTTTSLSTASGNWSFVGKVKDAYKNKERMVLNTLEEWGSDQSTTVDTDDAGSTPTTTVGDTDTWTSTYYSGEVATTYEIDQLKGKQMILMSEEANTNKWTNTPNGGSTTTTTGNDYTSMLTITLDIVK